MSVSRKADKELRKLPNDVQQRIEAAIDAMVADPFAGNVIALKGQSGVYRRRIGNYRIVFEHYGERTVEITGIRKRDGATYRSLLWLMLNGLG